MYLDERYRLGPRRGNYVCLKKATLESVEGGGGGGGGGVYDVSDDLYQMILFLFCARMKVFYMSFFLLLFLVWGRVRRGAGRVQNIAY